jgi:hypothetical protein
MNRKMSILLTAIALSLLPASLLAGDAKKHKLSAIVVLADGSNLNPTAEMPSHFAIRVSASTVWNVLPYPLVEGTTVTVQYMMPATRKSDRSGKWTPDPSKGWCGPEGLNHTLARDGYLAPGLPHGRLLYKIGDNGMITDLGSGALKLVVTKEMAGKYLIFACNDDFAHAYGKGYDDNEGYLTLELYLEKVLSVK